MNESQLFSCQESGAPDTYNKPPYSSPYSSSSYQEMLKQHAERMQVMNDISRSTGGALTAAPPASVAVTAPVTSLAFGTPSPMLHSTPQEKDNINIGSPNLFTAARQSSRKDGYGKTMTVCLCGSPDASQRQWTRSSGPGKSVCGVRSSSSKLSLYRSQGERTPDKLSTQPQPQQSQQGKSMLSLSCSCSSPLAQEQQGGEGGNEQQQQQQQQYLNVDNGGGEGEEEECDDEDVVMDGSEVKYAPLKWIIDTLLSQTTDTQFVQDFVLTMNLFMTPEELLATLVKKFYEPVPPNVIPSEIENYVKTVQNQEKIRIFLIIEKWVDSTWNSATDPALVQAVRNFIDGTNMTISASKLNRLINKRIVNEETKSMTTYANDPPAPRIVPFIESDAPAPVISLFTTSVIELARQETLLEHKLFYAIRPWEFQNLNFAKKDKRCAPNIHAFVTHFNTMSGWFTKVILDCSALQKRTRTVELLIDLAEAFCQLNNYNGLLEVMAALLSSSVFRLKRTWNGISRGHKVRFKEYMALASNAKNFAELRGRLKFVYGACVPYIGLYQTDLTFIEEGNPTRRGKLINWQKCKLQAGIIKTINEYRMNTYSLVHIPWMQDFLAKIQVTETENDFWSRSIALESRAELQASAGSNSSTGSSLTASAASSQSSSGSSSNASHMKEPRPRSLSSSSTTTGKASPSPMQNSAALGPAANAVFKVSMPGFTSFFDVPYPEKGRGGGDGCEIYPGSGLLLKQHIFDSIIGKLMRSKAKNIMEGMRDKMRELSLVEFSAEHLFGRGIGDDEQYDIADVYGLKFFSLFKRCCPVEITSGKSSAVMLAGLESPLHPLISAIITIFNINGNSGGSGDGGCGDGGNDSSNNSNDSSNGESNEFGLLMLDKDNNVLRWLNRNMSLREQGFQESNKIYVYPTAALSEKELDKAAFSRNPACKAGFLTKVGVRPLVRYGLQPRSSQLATASTSPSSSSNGNNNNSSGSSNKGTLRPPNPSIASLAHEAATIASLANMSGQVSHVLSSTLAVTSPPPSSSSLSLSLHHHQQQQQQSASSGSSSSSTEDAEKNWLLAVDGFLFYYKEYSAARPRRVFMLEYYNVTLGSLSGGQPCIILRLRADYPFRTRDARIALFTSKNEADLRAWYADLRRRSCMYRYTKVFGVPPAELALRSGAATFIPRQIQACAAQVFMHGAGVDALFASTQPPLATFERIKDSLDAGEVPEPRNAAELSVVAQALLSYFAELSEPLFTQEMVAALTPKDRDKDKDKDKDKEKEKEKERSATASTVLAEWLGKKLSQPHAFALLTLLLLLRTWGDSMPTGARKAAAVLSQYMPGPEKVTLRMAEDLLKAAAKAVIPPERCSFRTYVASLQKRVVAEYTSFKPIEGVALIAKEERSVIAQRIKAAFAIGAYKAPQQQQQKTVITQQQQQQQEKGVVVKQDSENSSPVLSTHSGVGSPSGSIGSPQIKWVSSYRKKPTLSPSTGSETCSPRLGGDDLSSDSLALECDSTVVAATITTTASSAAVAPPLAQGSLKIGSRNIGLASETKEE